MTIKKPMTGQTSIATKDEHKIARHGLRLVKARPEAEILQEIMGATSSPHNVPRSPESIARAKNNPLVRQLTTLADAIDAEIAMILKM